MFKLLTLITEIEISTHESFAEAIIAGKKYEQEICSNKIRAWKMTNSEGEVITYFNSFGMI